MLRYLAILPALAIFAGCSHYQFPVNQLESPEARGGSGQLPRAARIDLSVISGIDLIAPSTLSYPSGDTPGAPTPMAQSAMGGALGFTLSLGDRLDAGIRLEPQAPASLRLKYQFAGKPETLSGPGDFSASICAAPGLLLGLNGTITTTYLSGDFAVPVGYRIARNHLISLTPFFGFASVSGLTESVAATPSNSLSASRFGGGLGYQYSLEALFARAELSYASGSAADAKISGIFLGASFGLGL